MTQRNAETFKRLAAEVARRHEKGILDQFLMFLKGEGAITSDWPDEVKAEGNNTDLYFRPEGGLTKDHFEALVGIDPDASGMLAQAVVENMLRTRGLPAVATHRAANSLGFCYWEQVETPGDFERAANEVELKYYHHREEERQELPDAADPDEDKINPHGDWSVIVTPKGSFELTPLARKVFPVIYRAHRQGLSIHRDNVTKLAGVYSDRPDRCLRSSKIWGVVVGPVPGKGGFMRLLF